MDTNKKCPKCGQIDKTSFSSCRHCGTKYSGSPSQQSLDYAPFSSRVWAFLIDQILFLLITLGAFFVVPQSMLSAISEYFGKFHPIAGIGIDILIRWLYYALMESSASQGTIGKMIIGIRVTNMNGQRVSFLRASGRYFGRLVSSLLLGIGYLFPLFTEKKQTLHDMMAGCVVIRN